MCAHNYCLYGFRINVLANNGVQSTAYNLSYLVSRESYLVNRISGAIMVVMAGKDKKKTQISKSKMQKYISKCKIRMLRVDSCLRRNDNKASPFRRRVDMTPTAGVGAKRKENLGKTKVCFLIDPQINLGIKYIGWIVWKGKKKNQISKSKMQKYISKCKIRMLRVDSCLRRNDPAPNYGKGLFRAGQARDDDQRAVSISLAAFFVLFDSFLC